MAKKDVERKLKKKKAKKHSYMIKQHIANREKAEDAFNIINYKLHLHSNPEQHVQN